MIYSIVSDIEETDDYHIARILVLLSAFSKPNTQDYIDGLTKLAKLDFLLRYPTCLEKAMNKRVGMSQSVMVKPYERMSVESSMVRYKYGPWDFRYRRFINLLVSKNLAVVHVEGRKINICITNEGTVVANRLCNDELFQDIRNRAQLLKRNFNLTGTTLKNFIYKTFPEIATLDLGERISI
jgi:hypothetical protein